VDADALHSLPLLPMLLLLFGWPSYPFELTNIIALSKESN
jgi:hypothetical protein